MWSQLPSECHGIAPYDFGSTVKQQAERYDVKSLIFLGNKLIKIVFSCSTKSVKGIRKKVRSTLPGLCPPQLLCKHFLGY